MSILNKLSRASRTSKGRSASRWARSPQGQKTIRGVVSRVTGRGGAAPASRRRGRR